ncbi:phosphopantetheine-binding protein [Thermoleophilum album]|uniref:D-alanine--poly(Phosphoribitol) ligase, subunit 2 n=1 Tax=Thermoleophilum album TaxID=29539 RepID=A0A1H6G031_THEAL|nr:phosphopantetheine-binding protein [Thermoleophilum album]SEH15633.1 D-alanine--poly(phosphoribitol) ligase, subunit 2 [Thermoleophilum album]
MRALEDHVIEVMKRALALEPPARDSDLFESGLIDSLGLVTLITELEQEFGFQLPLEQFDLDCFRTVTSIAAQIALHVEQRDEREEHDDAAALSAADARRVARLEEQHERDQ